MADFLFDVYVRSLLLGAGVVCLLGALRSRSASFRHAVAILSLAILLALPVLRLTVPTRSLAWLPAAAPPQTQTDGGRGVKATTPPVLKVNGAAIPARRQAAQEPAVFFGIFALLGPALFTVRYLRGIATLRRWVRDGQRIEEPEFPVTLVLTREVSTPMTAWIGRHIILVPDRWSGWSASRKEATLRHEMAHVCRLDCFWQGLAQLGCAFYWPNPFVWLISREGRTFSEQAADDMVLAAGIDGRRYAQDLLDIARETRTTCPAPGISMAKEPDVARRIRMILNTDVRRGSVTVSSLIIGIALIGVIATPLAGARLTRPASTLAPPPRTAASSGHPQVEILVHRFKPGQTIEGTGTPNLNPIGSIGANSFELTARVPPPRAAGSSSAPDVFEVPVKAIPGLLKAWKAAGVIQTTSRIALAEGTNINWTTTDGSTGTRYDTLTLAPTARSKVVLELKASVDQHDGAKNGRHDWDFFIGNFGAVLLLHPDASGKGLEVFALLEIRKLGEDRVTP